MAADPQVQNALSKEIQQVAILMDAVFKLKQCRATIELLGIPSMSSDTLAQSVIGDLSHLDAGKVARLLAAMDVLDAAFLAPVDLAGVTEPPAKALVDVIR